MLSELFLLIDFTKVIVFWGRLWVNVGKKVSFTLFL